MPRLSTCHVFESAEAAWRELLSRLVTYGQHSSPRGKDVMELLSFQTAFEMSCPVVTNDRRKLGYRFMPAEAAWILSGSNRVDEIAPFSAKIGSFSDDGVTFFGAYGPKIIGQVQYVVNTLCTDPASRQAVINIWRESPGASKDIPCTLSLQFLIRDQRLHLVVTMRSSDAWLGWPYDVFTFTMVAAAVLIELQNNLKFKSHKLLKNGLGALYITAGSEHLYKQDLEGAVSCLGYGAKPLFEYRPFNHLEFETSQDLVNHLWWVARRRGSPDRPPRWLSELYGVKDEA